MAVDPHVVGAMQAFAGVVSLPLLRIGLANREKRGGSSFTVLVAAVAGWSLAAAAGNVVATYALSLSAYNVLLLAAGLATVAWLWLAVEVSGRLDRSGLLVAAPLGWLVVTQAALWTNPVHGLMLGPGTTVDGGVLVPEYATGLWLYLGVSYLFVVAGTGLLVVEAVRSTGLRRRQHGLLAVAVVPLAVGNLVSAFDLAFAPYDVAPFGYLLSAGVLALVLFRGRFLDIETFARRTAIAEMADGFLTVDEQYRVTDCNRAARRMFGVDDDCIGMPATEFFRTPGSGPVFDPQAVSETRCERTVTLDGDRRTILFTTAELGDSSPHGTVITLHDITAQKRREEQLERQNERLDQFASVVSHDLRNPLNVAQGNLQLARETGDDERFDAVERAHDHMEELVADLLTLARQGRTIDETEPVDLGAAAWTAWETVDTPDASLETSAAPVVDADDERLRQLLENLFRNAVEHAGPDVTVTVGGLGDRTGFFVADDGPGIPPDDRSTVFDFGHSTTDDGTGLGLAIAENIATAHGWEMRVAESEAGGARFEVSGVTTGGA